MLLTWVLGRKARREEEALCRLHPAVRACHAHMPAILRHLPWLDRRAA